MSDKIPNCPNLKLVPEFNGRALKDAPSPILTRAVGDILAPAHPDIPAPTISGNAPIAARAWLRDHADRLAPPDYGMLVQWLMPIAAGVGNTPAEDDFKRRVMALELGAGAMPNMAFNPATQRLGLATWVFLPSVAEIITLVREACADDLTWIAAVRRIAALD